MAKNRDRSGGTGGGTTTPPPTPAAATPPPSPATAPTTTNPVHNGVNDALSTARGIQEDARSVIDTVNRKVDGVLNVFTVKNETNAVYIVLDFARKPKKIFYMGNEWSIANLKTGQKFDFDKYRPRGATRPVVIPILEDLQKFEIIYPQDPTATIVISSASIHRQHNITNHLNVNQYYVVKFGNLDLGNDQEIPEVTMRFDLKLVDPLKALERGSRLVTAIAEHLRGTIHSILSARGTGGSINTRLDEFKDNHAAAKGFVTDELRAVAEILKKGKDAKNNTYESAENLTGYRVTNATMIDTRLPSFLEAIVKARAAVQETNAKLNVARIERQIEEQKALGKASYTLREGLAQAASTIKTAQALAKITDPKVRKLVAGMTNTNSISAALKETRISVLTLPGYAPGVQPPLTTVSAPTNPKST